jgi:Zn-dependent protease
MEKFGTLLLWFVPFIFSLSFHECAHAWTANRLGDPTARFLGRMTLNPVAHMDPIGTVVFPLLSFCTGVPLIGWARPVPVVERNLQDGRWGGLLVAAAGPISNLLLAAIFTALLALAMHIPGAQSSSIHASFQIREPLIIMAVGAIQLNIALALFNLIPLPPLDGGRVFTGLFPGLVEPLRVVERYGFIVILVLFYTGIVRVMVFYPSQILYKFLIDLAT